jgi:hypothetical protein
VYEGNQKATQLSGRFCDTPSHITSGFMDAGSDLAERSVRAALGFHRKRSAVGLPGSEYDGVGFVNAHF